MSGVVLWVVCPSKEALSLAALLPRSGREATRGQRMWSCSTDQRARAYSGAVASPARSSEEKVYEVVLKQAALVREQRSRVRQRGEDQKPDLELDRTAEIGRTDGSGLLDEAYDRCGQVCAEYAKTFYLGTSLSLFVWLERK